MSKEGSTLSGVMDGLALTVSLGLQYGVPLKVFVDKLLNTRFEPSGITANANIRFVSSYWTTSRVAGRTVYLRGLFEVECRGPAENAAASAPAATLPR